MAGPSRIRTPLIQRWHRFRQQMLPIVCFIGCVMLTLWLWQQQARMGNATGEIYAARVDVTSSATGLLASQSPVPAGEGKEPPYWSVFDRVQKGEVIARLDDRLLRAELVTLNAELVRLNRQMDATGKQLMFDQATARYEHDVAIDRERVQRWVNYERVRLDYLDRTAKIEEDKLELVRLDTLLQQLTGGLESLQQHQLGASNLQYNLEDMRLQRDVVKKRISANEKALEEAFRQGGMAKDRTKYDPKSPIPPQIQQLLTPLHEAITVQETRVDHLKARIESLTIRAPISGTIAAIHSWPGQTVQPGAPIVTIASDRGEYIVSYVRQGQRIQPAKGMKVTLRPRRSGSQAVESVVEDVGPQYELIPSDQLMDPNTPEWGLPVRIRLPAELRARPGERLDIDFPPSHRQSS